MKDNLFEMLLNLFEKSLSQLRKSHQSINPDLPELDDDDLLAIEVEKLRHIKNPELSSIRVFTYDEQMKLTKASYQFLMKMKLLNVIDPELFETILSQLQLSESRIITLQETKWTIRNILAEKIDEKQLSFLDLILYQTEDKYTLH